MGKTRTEKKYTSSIKFLIILSVLLFIGTIMLANPMQPSKVVKIITNDGFLEVSTSKTLVADILEAANITFDANYQKSYPSLGDELVSGSIVIIQAAKILITVDGSSHEIYTWAETVEGFLAEQGITIDGDIINYPNEENILEGMHIHVTRVTTELLYQEAVIPAQTTYRNDSSLLVGKQQVQTQARDGKKKIAIEVVYHDGVEASRSIIGEEILAEPVSGLILKGTQALPSRSTINVIEGIASYYGAELHGNLTASGVPFDMHALTAAHKTLPFGTKVKVTYLATGKSVIVEINDRGPFIAGRIIDLSAAAAKSIGLYSAGIGKVRVEILK